MYQDTCCTLVTFVMSLGCVKYVIVSCDSLVCFRFQERSQFAITFTNILQSNTTFVKYKRSCK